MSEIPPDNVPEERIKEILEKSKVIAVVGASRTEGKPAHFVPAYLKSKGYKIIPINPFADEILGEKAYKSLLDIPSDVKIDVVDVFRPSEEVTKVVEEAIKRGVKIVWLQLGIYNKEAVELAKKNNIEIIWDRCMMETHKRLFKS
ncbi:MAG: CoA-binding protein [Thermoproteota archaeon]|jgi:predicted CoA-binding protein|nr:CoA-binding protein [Thermoproteota archaeon]